MVSNGYTLPLDANSERFERRQMSDHQRKDHKNHHESRNIFLHAISYLEYERISKRELAHSIFDSLKRTHEVDKQMEITEASDQTYQDEYVIKEEYEALKKDLSMALIIKTYDAHPRSFNSVF